MLIKIEIKINEHNNSDIMTSITGPIGQPCFAGPLTHLLRDARARDFLPPPFRLAVWVPSRSDLDLN